MKNIKEMANKGGGSFVTAALLTAISLLVFLLTKPVLSTAGDINIAGHLAASKIRPGFFFISPALASLLRALSGVFKVNWWSVFSIIVMFAGLFIFLWFINERNREGSKASRFLLMVLFAVFFWEAILRFEVNFTQTTVIAGLSGIVLIADCCYEGAWKYRKTSVLKIVLGTGFLLLAGSVRWKALLLMLPFGVMCLLYIFIMPLEYSDIKLSLQKSFGRRKVALVLSMLLVLTVFISNAAHKLYGVINPNLKEYVVANALREDICDYTERYPEYEEAEADYQKLGITHSWINMVNNFLTGDLNHFSSQDLKKMVDMRQDSRMTIRDFAESLKGHGLLWIIIALLVGDIAVLKGKKNTWLPFLGCGFAFTCCALYFVHIGRFGWRVTNGCILACIISFIAMSAWPISDYKPKKNRGRTEWQLLALSMVLCLVWAVAVRMEKQVFCFPVAEVTDEEQAGVLEYMNSNPDRIYVGVDKTVQFYRAYNMWAVHEPDYLSNTVTLNAHFIIGEDKILERGGGRKSG